MKRMGQPDTENTQATDSGVNFDQVTYNVLTADGVLTPSMVSYCVYQNRLESNNYTSNVFKSDNNLNGYKFVPPSGSAWQDGPGTLSPEGDPYGHYSSIENSAHEQSGWWQRRRDQDGLDLTSITTISAFVAALTQYGWFTSSPTAYVARMTAVSALADIQTATGISTEGISNTAFLVGFGIALFFVIKA